jgi:hypothetical protein
MVVNTALVLKSVEQNHGYSPTLLVAVGLQIWYALDSLWFEESFLASFEIMYEGTGYMLAVGYHMYPFIPTVITRFVLVNRFVVPMLYLIRTVISTYCCHLQCMVSKTVKNIH